MVERIPQSLHGTVHLTREIVFGCLLHICAYVCVCGAICAYTSTHTHTHVGVCVCVCVFCARHFGPAPNPSKTDQIKEVNRCFCQPEV